MNEILNEIQTLKAENLVLKMVCSALLVEISALHDDPPRKLDETLASLQGVAAGLASEAGGTEESAAITKTVELISTWSETVLSRPDEPE